MQTGAGTLDNVTIPGGSIVQVTNGSSSVLSVKNGLTLDGTVLIGDTVGNAYFGAMFLTTTQTISGSGSIIFGNNVNNNISASTNGVTITLGPDLKVRGKNGEIRGSSTSGDFTHYILQGTIESDVAGGSLDVGHFVTDIVNTGRLKASNGGNLIVRPETWSNSGATSISGGGTLTIAPNSWTNTGTVAMIDSTVNLGGAFTKTALGTFTRVGGIVNLTGTLDITGTALALDNTTGSWILQSGTISGGRVSTAGTAELFAGATQGTLNAVTLAGKFSGSRAAVTGGLTLEQGLIDVGLLALNGTQTLGGTGTVTFTGNNPNNDVRVSNNATLTIGPGVTIHGETGFIGSPFTGRILNLGTIAADGGGTLTVQGINNFSSGVLTGGTWKVSGNSTLRLIGADIITNAADILRDGANARLLSNIFSTNVLAGLTTNTAAGSLRLLNGASLTTSASSFDNRGSLTIGSGSTLTVGGGYLTAGASVIDGSLITNTVTVDPAGTLSGSGTVTGNVVNNGQVRPGSPLGSLSINGSYTQASTGRLEIEIGGTIAGSRYDRLSVSGPATLNGSLAVRLANGFGPTTGQHYEVMNFANHAGAFSEVTGLSQGRFPLFDLTVNAANVELNALANATDLAFDAFQSNTFPPSAMPGQDVSLTYTVKNLSEPPANDDWVDSVYLSRDNIFDPNDTLLTRIDHRGGVAGFGSYTETLTAPFPGLAEGGYRVIVVADSRGLASDADRSNNSGVSTQAINVSVPLLTSGTPVNGSIAPGKDLYFRVLAGPARTSPWQRTSLRPPALKSLSATAACPIGRTLMTHRRSAICTRDCC